MLKKISFFFLNFYPKQLCPLHFTEGAIQPRSYVYILDIVIVQYILLERKTCQFFTYGGCMLDVSHESHVLISSRDWFSLYRLINTSYKMYKLISQLRRIDSQSKQVLLNETWCDYLHGMISYSDPVFDNILLLGLWVRVMVFNATFNNISVVVVVNFIGGGNRSTLRKPLTCRNYISH